MALKSRGSIVRGGGRGRGGGGKSECVCMQRGALGGAGLSWAGGKKKKTPVTRPSMFRKKGRFIYSPLSEEKGKKKRKGGGREWL